MDKTGGQPNLLAFNPTTTEYIFCDFSKESPLHRRSLCYDKKALEARKKFKPADSARNMTAAMGISLMNQEQYERLLEFGELPLVG